MSGIAKPTQLRPRLYQKELLQLALQGNVIAYLTTGTGKTLVAAMLISERLDRLREQHKKAIFTAPRVILVHEQAKVIKTQVDVNGGILTGEMGPDLWSAQQWKDFLNKHDVIVTVPQLLLNALQGGFLKMTDIGLLIVDECHHTKGKSPGNQAMQDFYIPTPPDQRPKVFGMTASPLDEKANTAAKMQKKYWELETNLDCKVVTVMDRAEVEVFAPTPTLSWLHFHPDVEGTPLDHASKVIAACAALLRVAEERCKLRESLRRLTMAAAQFPALQGKGNLWGMDSDGKSTVLGDMARMLDKVAVCAKDLGPWCGAAAFAENLKPGHGDSIDYKAIQYLKATTTATPKPPPIGVRDADLQVELSQFQKFTQMLQEHMPHEMWHGVPEHELELAAMRFTLTCTFAALMDALLPRTADWGAKRTQLDADFKHAAYNMDEHHRQGCSVYINKLLCCVTGKQFVDQCLGRALPSALHLPCSLVTNKVTKAVLYLLEDKAKFGEAAAAEDASLASAAASRSTEAECLSWSCLVFVQRKITAVVLQQLISQLGQYDNDLGQQLACGKLIAYNGSGSAESMDLKAQQAVLAEFKRGLLQVLIASSVAEEGLDLRRCQLVLRFDPPTNPRAFVQSRGRARMKNSRMIMMIDESHPELQQEIECHYKQYEDSMHNMAQERAMNMQLSDDENEQEEVVADPASVYRVEATGATLTIQSAKPLLFRYTQKLPSDRYHMPLPQFSTKHLPGGSFQSTVYLPNNAAVFQAVGRPQANSRMARNSASLEACILLHKQGALTDNLVPVVECPDMSAYVQVEGDEGLDSDTPGVRVRAIPKALTPAAPNGLRAASSSMPRASSVDIYSFALLASTAASFPPHHPLLQVSSWCILLQKKLPELPAFPVWLHGGGTSQEASMQLQHKAHMWMDQGKLALLQRAHQYVLSLVIEDQASPQAGSAMIPDSEWSQASGGTWYIMAPQQQQAQQGACINWDLASTLAKGGKHVSELIDLQQFSSSGQRNNRQAKAQLEALVADKIVCTTYNNVRYLCKAVAPDLNLSSPFPLAQTPQSPQYETYQEYYALKHKRTRLILSQPLLLAKRCEWVTELGRVEYCLRPFRDKDTKQADRQLSHIPVTDAVMQSYPDMHTAPGREHRDWGDGRNDMAVTGLDVLSEHGSMRDQNEPGQHESELELVPKDVHEKVGRLQEVALVPELCCVLPLPPMLWKSVRFLMQLLHRMEWLLAAEEVAASKILPRGCHFTAPILPVLHCLTTTSADEHHSMERFEQLGDTVLKFCTATHLYHKYGTDNEELLTSRKDCIVNNVRLAKLGRTLGLQSYLLTYKYDLKSWRPPGSSRPPPNPPRSEVHSKRVADMVEALLGAVYHTCGLAAAVEYLIYTRILPEEARQHICSQTNTQQHEDLKRELLALASLDGTEAQLPPVVVSCGQEYQEAINATGWHFSPCGRNLVREALTHASWPMPAPPCYQRLECLGDACLDLVVTYLAFLIYPDAGPGMLTEVRKATVNNDRLAFQSANLKLHTRLLHFSTQLSNDRDKYLQKLEDIRNANAQTDNDAPPAASATPHPSLMADMSNVANPKNSIRHMWIGDRMVSVASNDWASVVVRARTAPPVRNAPKVMADVIESVLAAVFLDSGMDVVVLARACFRMGLLNGISGMLQGLCKPVGIPMEL